MADSNSQTVVDDKDNTSLLDQMSESSQQIAISSVLLAASVAWADGVVQLNEKNKLIEMAKREQERDAEFPFDKVMTWLSEPPSEDEVEDALAILANDSSSIQYVKQAKSIAKADGNISIAASIGIGFLFSITFWMITGLVTGIVIGSIIATTLITYFSLSNNAISREEEIALNWLNSSLNEESYSSQKHSKSNWKNRIDTLKIVMDERSVAQRQEKWRPPMDSKPVPCPQYPGRMPPSVTEIPEHEYQAFRSKIVKRYVQALIGETWSSLEVAHNLPETLDDEIFNEIYWNSPFSRFLTPTFSDNDLSIFDQTLSVKMPSDKFFKIDHTHLGEQKTYPGVYIAPVIGLFKQVDNGIEVVSILVNEKCFTPKDGESWERARLFLLQGSSLSLVGGVHASLHFPTDSVIAITRQRLPINHPMAQVIEAHSYLQLPLTTALVNSILHFLALVKMYFMVS